MPGCIFQIAVSGLGLFSPFMWALMLLHQLLFAAAFALVCGCQKCFTDRKPENYIYLVGVTHLDQKQGEGRKHICQIPDYIFHSWRVCITFQWLPFKERKPPVGLFFFNIFLQVWHVHCVLPAIILYLEGEVAHISTVAPVPDSKTGQASLIFPILAFSCQQGWGWPSPPHPQGTLPPSPGERGLAGVPVVCYQ